MQVESPYATISAPLPGTQSGCWSTQQRNWTLPSARPFNQVNSKSPIRAAHCAAENGSKLEAQAAAGLQAYQLQDTLLGDKL